MWKRGCFAAHSGFLIAFLCTAVVGQVCKTAVGLHFSVVLSSCSVVWSSLGLTENTRSLPKVNPADRQGTCQKRQFSTTAPKGLIDKTLDSLFTTLIFFTDSKFLGRGDPGKEKRWRTQALSVVGQCRAPEGGKCFSSSLQQFLNQLFCFSLIVTPFTLQLPTNRVKH